MLALLQEHPHVVVLDGIHQVGNDAMARLIRTCRRKLTNGARLILVTDTEPVLSAIERMEVVLGPGAALYGPNTANGVLHIFTKSPLDSASEGTTVTLGGGQRSVFQGSFRSALEELDPQEIG